MGILNRYILKEFIKGMIICLLVILFVYIIVELFENISKFVDKGVGLYDILRYYTYEIPEALNLVFPISLLIACFISIGSMSKNFELVAIRASGINPARIISPLIVLGFIVVIVMFFVSQTILPRSMQAEERFKREVIDKLPPKKTSVAKDVYFVGEGNRLYHINLIDGSDNSVKGVIIYTFSSEMSLVERIDAKAGVYREPFWVFYNGVIRRWNGGDEKEVTLRFDTLKVDWLKEGIAELLQERKKPETMNYLELRRYIDFRRRGGYDVTGELSDLYYMISYQFINLIIILIGVPLASKVRTSSFALGLAIAMLSSFLYWGFTQLGRAFGKAGIISPALGSWLPNLIFALAGAVLIMDNVRR